ncbi:MAG: MBL fold metallo-hydrolase [Holosporales bacterium]|jgi:L-ascorbate metabolism protein UlaG (beta-lactamase superfamily)|nr:MBL fold metallo-hydrolase [Holosporales bacterium]
MGFFGYFFAIAAVMTVLSVVYVVESPKFGSLPGGARLERIQSSKNYMDGQFRNMYVVTARAPVHKLGAYKAIFSVLSKLIVQQDIGQIPSMKTNLMSLKKTDDVLVWFGHSSYFIQLEGKRIIVDPVLSSISSPIPFFPTAFNGTNVYAPSEIPEVDYLIITHDHWDHLDYASVMKLKTKKVICPLGVGAHFERWGFDQSKLIEMDWDEEVNLPGELKVKCHTAQHFSGRCFSRNKALWASFLITTKSGFKIYIGGDSGYGPHFKDIGKQHGGIDIAILENGQYNVNWRDIHMHPEETVRAAEDLGTRTLIPVHNSKFALSTHPWNEPLDRISKICCAKSLRLITPMIGQTVNIRDAKQQCMQWWQNAVKN